VKVVKREVLEVSYADVEQAIMDFYNVSADHSDIGAMEEWHNYSSYAYNVIRGPLSKQDTDSVAKFKLGHTQFVLGSLLNDMCLAGNIEPGRYFINVYY